MIYIKNQFSLVVPKKIHVEKDLPKEPRRTSCLLPMQYQNKIDKKFLWQCFKCGKKFLIFEINGESVIEEIWSPPK